MEIKSKEITLVPTTKLVEYPKNAHVHSPEQIDRLVKLIEHYGFRDPLIVDADVQQDGTHWVMAGNGRLKAALEIGTSLVPVVFQSFKSDDEKYGFMVSHNAIGKDSWASLNLDLIKTEVLDLGPDFNIDMLGMMNFNILGMVTDEDETKNESDKKLLLQVELPNELERRDLYDDLISKGYLVKEL